MPSPVEDRWSNLAFSCAARAYVKRDESRRGLLLVEDDDVIVFFDSNLPQDSMALRERIAERFRERLAEEGVEVLAAATFPQSGADDGLAMALVLDANAENEDGVTRAWERTAEDPIDTGES